MDDKIELNRKMNETLESMAQALFKSWFVDFDPVRRNMDRSAGKKVPSIGKSASEKFQTLEIDSLFPDSFQSSELGPIPEGWMVTALGKVAGNSRCGILPKQIAPNTPYIGLDHMPRRCIALSDRGYSDDLGSNKFEFKCGQILFGKLRPYFHKVGVAPVDGVCSTDILVIEPKTPAWFGFVLCHVSSVELVNHTAAASTGTRMPRTNWNDISRFAVALPPESLAVGFTDKLRPMIDKIIENIHESRTLATLRDTLLPKLLSGELSLPAATLVAQAGIPEAEKIMEGV